MRFFNDNNAYTDRIYCFYHKQQQHNTNYVVAFALQRLIFGGEMNSQNNALIILCVLLIGCMFILIAIAFVNWYIDFKRELRRVNMEIRRTSGRERKYWRKRKHRLYLSIIPFVKY